MHWVGSPEVKILLDMIDVSFYDQVLSSKYLCYKYISKMMANHLNAEQMKDWSTYFNLVGHMPQEFYSTRTIMDDKEARDSVSTIC